METGQQERGRHGTEGARPPTSDGDACLYSFVYRQSWMTPARGYALPPAVSTYRGWGLLTAPPNVPRIAPRNAPPIDHIKIASSELAASTGSRFHENSFLKARMYANPGRCSEFPGDPCRLFRLYREICSGTDHQFGDNSLPRVRASQILSSARRRMGVDDRVLFGGFAELFEKSVCFPAGGFADFGESASE